MATKRVHSDVHPARRDQVPEEPRRKRQKTKPEHIKGKSFKKAYTVHDLKSQIRSLRRVLEHNSDLPANVRVEKERELQTAQHALAETERAKRRSEMIAKWHKVRFFERQKATKRLKKARKELAACAEDEDGKAELEDRVKQAEIEMNYAIYFPLEKDYVPLFAKRRRKEDAADDGDEHQGDLISEGDDIQTHGDQEVWKLVEEAMRDGTLETLRNGRPSQGEAITHATNAVPRPKRSKPKHGSETAPAPIVEGNRRERRSAAAAARADNDDDSDGGFFE